MNDMMREAAGQIVAGIVQSAGPMMHGHPGVPLQQAGAVQTRALMRQAAVVQVPMHVLRMMDDALRRAAETAQQSRRLCDQLSSAFAAELQTIKDCRDLLSNLSMESGNGPLPA